MPIRSWLPSKDDAIIVILNRRPQLWYGCDLNSSEELLSQHGCLASNIRERERRSYECDPSVHMRNNYVQVKFGLETRLVHDGLGGD